MTRPLKHTLILSAYAEGMPTAKIAKLYGVTRSAPSMLVRRYGQPLRRPWNSNNKKRGPKGVVFSLPPETLAEIRALLTPRLTQRDVAKMYGVSQGTISRILAAGRGKNETT